MTPIAERSRRVLALVPVACGIGVAVLVILTGGVSDVDATVLGFLLWNLVPHALLAVVVLQVSRHAPRAWPALVGGVVLHVVLTVAVLAGALLDDSSTAALVFIFLPAYLLAAVVLTALTAGVVSRVRRSRAAG